MCRRGLGWALVDDKPGFTVRAVKRPGGFWGAVGTDMTADWAQVAEADEVGDILHEK